MNNKLIILCGVPASGKSTFAEEYIKANSGWVRVSRDSFRFMLKDVGFCEPKIEKLITDLVRTTIKKCFAKNLNVIYDATNLKLSTINDIVGEFKYYADIDFRVFDISLEKAIERDTQRNKKHVVGEEVIKRMYKDFKILMDNYDKLSPIKKVKEKEITPDYQSKLEHAVIFDIDGTIALMRNRYPYDWDKVDNDDPNLVVIEHIMFHKSLGRKIILLSGRDGSSRKLTEDWLKFYNIDYDLLLMREANDNRSDKIIKRELYYNEIKDKFNVICVYDDRLQVLDMWYEEGVFTYNVNQGLREF